MTKPAQGAEHAKGRECHPGRFAFTADDTAASYYSPLRGGLCHAIFGFQNSRRQPRHVR